MLIFEIHMYIIYPLGGAILCGYVYVCQNGKNNNKTTVNTKREVHIFGCCGIVFLNYFKMLGKGSHS